ncbi:hypothetical protein KY46_12825 [Photobacterium halotolerans]|uniref:Uncharacterized protein n=1 Tax=Photobacterium halotolerans TaxID=265726 RepID=A0A0F5VBP7_9GAMM|nr:hypothetical protein KY46_12825 [Photobacterium halotolerans]
MTLKDFGGTYNLETQVIHSTGKNSGRIFRLSAPGAPTTVPAHAKEQKGISGYCLCQQRVTGARHTMPRDTQNLCATYFLLYLKSLVYRLRNIEVTPNLGKNSGRIFRLSALGAPTTVPAHIKEPKGLFWALFGPTKSVWRASHNAERCTKLKRDILTQS